MKKFELDDVDIDLNDKLGIATIVHGLSMSRWEELFTGDKELVKKYYEKILLNPHYKSYFDVVVRISRSIKSFNKSIFDYNMGILNSMYPSKRFH